MFDNYHYFDEIKPILEKYYLHCQMHQDYGHIIAISVCVQTN
jgi:hypothetical protein